MATRNCLVLPFYTLSDPTSRHTITSLQSAGWKVTVLQPPVGRSAYRPMEGVEIIDVQTPKLPTFLRPLHSMLRWRAFQRQIGQLIRQRQPELVVTFMLHPVALLPTKHVLTFRLLSCVYDIPSLPDCGHLDRRIIEAGWKRLPSAAVVWASDRYKAELTQERASLPRTPLVCHNCPPRDFMPDLVARDPWLRAELRRQGASIGEEGGCIMVRAGAIGEACGLEQTLVAMRQLPDDYLFLMMGRPEAAYKERIRELIAQQELRNRAFFWDRPSDEVWKRALAGADIGHLIHGPYAPGAAQRAFNLNSSLSNYRLFDYMAAGLPILSYDDSRLSALAQEVACFRVAAVANLTEDIATLWRELGCDAALRQRLGRAGRAAHLEKYHWEEEFAPVLQAVENELAPAESTDNC